MVIAVIFDVDGVLVDSPHEECWRQALRLAMETDWKGAPGCSTSADVFTTQFYQQFVAGKPRLEGARCLLEQLGMPDVEERAVQLSERKQQVLLEMLEAGRFGAYEDGLRLLLRCIKDGLRVVAASSSKNAHKILSLIFVSEKGCPLIDLFHASVCGMDVERGKPDPELFLVAARSIGVEPSYCLVVEDAPSGVRAAKAAGMSCIGVARHDDAALLRNAGADWVVQSLDEVRLEDALRWEPA